MAWLVRTLRLPAAETHTSVALAICVFLMGLLSVAIIWQAQVIANQRDASPADRWQAARNGCASAFRGHTPGRGQTAGYLRKLR